MGITIPFSERETEAQSGMGGRIGYSPSPQSAAATCTFNSAAELECVRSQEPEGESGQGLSVRLMLLRG